MDARRALFSLLLAILPGLVYVPAQSAGANEETNQESD
ncbi:MAG: hypothetical protein HFACDABA_01243 [Anaerolineales bacterium]|nr:hypothetical protein [Anaerolineales bacterium]